MESRRGRERGIAAVKGGRRGRAATVRSREPPPSLPIAFYKCKFFDLVCRISCQSQPQKQFLKLCLNIFMVIF